MPSIPFLRAGYISNGRCCTEDALRQVGMDIFGEEWTGDELLFGTEEAWDNFVFLNGVITLVQQMSASVKFRAGQLEGI